MSGVSSYTGEGRHFGGNKGIPFFLYIKILFFETGPEGPELED
jgi:hypothetical protein